MTFRNENTATATATTTPKKRNRVRMAVMGGAMLALPVAGLVAANTASAAPTSTWDAVAQCESTGNWSINSGNGFYGGLQFTSSTWAAYGGTQYAASADQATKDQQIAIAEKVLADQGPGAWPVCSVKAGLTAGGAPAAVDTSSSTTTGSTTATKQSAPVQQATPKAATPAQQPTAPKVAVKPAVKPAEKPVVAKAADKPAAPTSTKPTTGATYTVKSGDTLSAIAAAHGTNWQSLYQHNAQVVGANADLILPGQVLSI
ncbi:transglycosylase family protein [Kitasatospora azatica]|uniref:transglycosylase family protein n=1 Tax=Kitasatospora azatica TaxID=58347 RepID=UPI000A05F261|nr:transglycosylase family protein [Kitasatospora azatica]